MTFKEEAPFFIPQTFSILVREDFFKLNLTTTVLCLNVPFSKKIDDVLRYISHTKDFVLDVWFCDKGLIFR